MAAAHDEYHNNVEEYFPINDPVKGKRNFNRKSAGAVGVMLTASAGIIAAALTLLLLFCSATAVSPSSASFPTTVCNIPPKFTIMSYPMTPFLKIRKSAVCSAGGMPGWTRRSLFWIKR